MGSSHLLHDAFKKELWNAVLKWTQASINAALDCFMKRDPVGKLSKSKSVAFDEMFKSKQWRKRMKNFIPAGSEKQMANDIAQIYLQTKKADNDCAAKAREDGHAYQSLFTKTTPNTNTLGTKEAVDHFIQHILKGCFSDPLPPDQMSYPTTRDPPKDGGPFVYNRKRGTNIVESGNKTGRIATLSEATRQRSELSHKRYLIFVSLHNLMIDAKIAHLTGKNARPRDWFIREALSSGLTRLTRTVFDDNVDYPPEIDLSKYSEPIGELYQLYDEWERIDMELQQFSETAINNQPMVDEFGDFSGFAELDLSQFDLPLSVPVPGPGPGPESVPAVAAVLVPAPVPAPAPVAPAAAMDGGQAQFSARLEQRVGSPQKKKAKTTNLLGAERWGIRKAHITDASVNKVYITELSSYHRECLGTAYGHAIHQLGLSATTHSIVEKMVEIFNGWHTLALQQGDCNRFKGYITRRLVELYLKQQGRAAIGHQMHQRIWQPASRELTLTDSQIDELSRDRARVWCKQLNLAVKGTKEELRLRLKKYFK